MIRGTNAQFIFKFPYTELAWATIKFWQPHNPNKLLPIIKKLEDYTCPDGFEGLHISLTAEETARFLDKYKGCVQFRAQDKESGTVFGIPPQLFTVYPMEDEALEYPITDNGWVVLDGGEIIGESGGDING